VVYAVAFDPGGTTGIAIVEYEAQPWNIGVMQMSGEHHERLYAFLHQVSPQHIICESFQNRGQDAAILTSLEYIGVVKLYCQTVNKPPASQLASTGKGFWNNVTLHKHGIYIEGLRHARDAIRHYAYWRTFTLKDHSLLRGDSSGQVYRYPRDKSLDPSSQ
jgi:hypothetical protein